MTIPESFRKVIVPVLVGAACAGVVAIAGRYAVDLQLGRFDAHRKIQLIALGSLLQARLNRELNRELYLTSGLNSYLVVRGGSVRPVEVEAILAALYADTRYVRNFGVAVGYRIAYIHPLKGNEKAIGLYYPDVRGQWPAVKRLIDGGVPVLLGPIDLVQGGRGLIYRVPVYIRGTYWGLVSTVIDVDSLLVDAFKAANADGVEVALRGKDGAGMDGAVFHGDPQLFSRPGAEIIEVGVPGGKWVMALRAKTSLSEQRELRILSALMWILAAFVGWSAYLLLLQRAKLARMALTDALTGLPNRSLIEDRIRRAIAAARRDSSAVSTVLFIDLDGFKDINDRLGHRAGDAVLQGVAERVVRAVREIDSIGRWGGDEFVVLLENASREELPELIARVRNAVEVPLDYSGTSLKVGASIGTAIVPDSGNTVDELIRLADSRMYEDKQARARPAAT